MSSGPSSRIINASARYLRRTQGPYEHALITPCRSSANKRPWMGTTSGSVPSLARVFKSQRPLSSMATFDVSNVFSMALNRTFYTTIDETPEHVGMLACSSATSSLSHDQRRFFNRMRRRLENWIRAVWEAVLVSLRTTEIVLRLSPLAILTPAAIVSAHFQAYHSDAISNVAWRYTMTALQSLGPAFVKLAQWAATRRDIFPPHVCDRLAQLHDKGFPHSWSHTHKILTDAFGPYEAKGLHIDPEDIIGCGSAAQVYKASLTTTDAQGLLSTRTVAVKVLHPRFQQLVDRDFAFIQSVADFLHALPFQMLEVLNLPRVAHNFGLILRRQADLRIEGRNLHQFRTNFYGQSDNLQCQVGSAVFFPLPVEGWMDRNVLVEDLVVDAQPISHFLRDSSKEGWAIRRELAGPLLRAFLKMVFLDNFVHCDLHPGNVLVQTSYIPASKWSWDQRVETKRTIVFLDAGITTSLSPEDKRNLKDLFRAVILNEGNRAGRLMVERAKCERCSQVEGGVDAFASGVEDIVSEFHDRRKQGLTLGAVRIGSLLSRVLDLCREHGVEVDPAMASVVISTLVLEGLGRSLEPDMNLIDCAVPFVLGRGQV